MIRLFPAVWNLNFVLRASYSAQALLSPNITFKESLKGNTSSDIQVRIPKMNSTSAISSDNIMDPNRQLNYDELIVRKTKGNTLLVDVRELSEIKETGKLPGSIHIPLGDLENALNASHEMFFQLYGVMKPGKDTTLIFSCRSGKRSVSALEIALRLNYKNASHYKGGWLEWAEKNANK